MFVLNLAHVHECNAMIYSIICLMYCCVEPQHLPAVLSSSASIDCMHACLCVLAILLAQEQDSKVMSHSHQNSGSWSPAGFLSLQSEPGHELCLQKACVLHWSLYLFPFLEHILSLHLAYTFFHPLYFSFSASACLGVGPPSSADIWVAFRNQPVTVNTRRGGEGRGETVNSDWCQHCYFLHHRTRLDTNNGMRWQSFRKTAREKWATANPRLCKSICSRLSLEL